MGIENTGLIRNRAWDQVSCPTNNMVVRTERVCVWKRASADSWPKRSTRCLVYTSKAEPCAHGVGNQYRDDVLDTTEAIEDRELRHLDVQRAFVQSTVDEEVHIGLPEEYEYSPGAVGEVSKAMHDVVQASQGFSQKLVSDIKTQGV